MKRLTTIFCLLTLLSACGTMTEEDEIKSFIPGVYVTKIDGPYSKGYDTLQLSAIHDESNSYRISRKTAFHRIIDGKVFPAEVKEEAYTGIYDEQDKIINETTKGNVFSFDPGKKILLLGTSEYRKVQ